MNLHITKSKNAESFYICKSFVKANGRTSSMIIRKLGTLEQLLVENGPTRDDVLAWAKNEVKIETEKYKKEWKYHVQEEPRKEKKIRTMKVGMHKKSVIALWMILIVSVSFGVYKNFTAIDQLHGHGRTYLGRGTVWGERFFCYL